MQTSSNPFRTLAIKWEVNILLKKYCVRLYHCVVIIVSLWYGTWEYNNRTRLIGSSLFDRPLISVRAKVKCCKSIDSSITGSRTAQILGSRPQALRVVTHGQLLPSLGQGSYPSAEVQLVYSIVPAESAGILVMSIFSLMPGLMIKLTIS